MLQFTTHNLLLLPSCRSSCPEESARYWYFFLDFNSTTFPSRFFSIWKKALTISHCFTKMSNKQVLEKKWKNFCRSTISLMLKTFIGKATEDPIRISLLHLRSSAGAPASTCFLTLLKNYLTRTYCTTHVNVDLFALHLWRTHKRFVRFFLKYLQQLLHFTTYINVWMHKTILFLGHKY